MRHEELEKQKTKANEKKQTKTYLLYNRKNPRLSIVIAVGTDTLLEAEWLAIDVGDGRRGVTQTHQIDFESIGIGSEGTSKAKHAILRSLRDDAGREAGSRHGGGDVVCDVVEAGEGG